MPRYPKNYKDVEYFVPGRKRRIAGSTVATRDFLAIVHEEHPTATIAQLRAIITRIWQNAKADEYTNRIIHEGFGERGAK